ncbi:MAG: leucine-rich repeat domain-containing protein, partial [Candidatus Promineifilaceae bacterium]
QTLDLSHNQLTSLSSGLSGMGMLQTLNLSNNQLTSISSGLSGMGMLQTLDLSNNQLATISFGYSGLHLEGSYTLQTLNLSHNQLTAISLDDLNSHIPLPHLDLSNNQLSSISPNIRYLDGLQTLDLSDNQLISIPPEVGHLNALDTLDLSSNLTLSGVVPLAFRNLSLSQFDFSSTGLCEPQDADFQTWIANIPSLGRTNTPCSGEPVFDCATVTEIPLIECEALVALYSSTNGENWTNNTNWLQSSTPCSLHGGLNKWDGVECMGVNAVMHINLWGSNLTGTLPPEIGNLSFLQILDIPNNPALSGAIPTTLTNSPLQGFHFDNTLLCEPQDAGFQAWILPIASLISTNIPCSQPTFGCNNVTEIPLIECQALEALYNSTGGDNWTVNTDWLQTNTPCSWHGVTCGGSNVLQIDLSSNSLAGAIPPEIGDFASLQTLLLYSNQLTTFPSEIGGLSSLNTLTISGNPASGAVPSAFINILSLSNFHFNNTQLCEPQDADFQNWFLSIPNRGTTNIACPQQPGSVQIILFAGDNRTESAGNLTTKYQETVQGIVDASVGELQKTSIILADLDGPDDTHVLLVHNGVVTSMVGLPDVNGMLTTTINEYNMTDGVQLGGFLKWALDNHTDSDTKTALSYYGHGTFLAPNVDLDSIFATSARSSNGLIPLPHTIGAFPNFTDVHPQQSLITPYAIRQMLEIGTNNGATSLDVLDLTHCFALSLEEVYEVSNDGGSPFAEMIVGSPNYAYFAPSMAGAAFATMNPNDDAATLATNLMTAYDAEIAQADLADNDPDVDHPRTLVVVDSAALTGVKALFDEMAWYLLSEFDADPVGTATKLKIIAENTPSYDTTYCAQDFELDASDALRDVGAFLPQVTQQFGFMSGAGSRALQARALLANAIVANTVSNGTPWFAAPLTPTWTFDQSNALGLSFYADLIGQTDGNIRSLAWHGTFYSDDLAVNPTPYRFITGNNPTWADVFTHYWDTRATDESLVLETKACLTELPPVIEQGELSVEAISSPLEGGLHVGHATSLEATIRTESAVFNPQIQFNVIQSGTVIFTNTVSAGYMVTGTYTIESSQPFTPTTTGIYTFEVTVNPDARIIESNVSDNYATHSDFAAARAPFNFSASIQNGLQWTQSNTVTLELTHDAPLDVLIVQTYQYQPGSNPASQVPILVDETIVYNLTTPIYESTLPNIVTAGHVIQHIWGVSVDGRLSQAPAVVAFNYAPDSSTLTAGEIVYYHFNAELNDDVSIGFDLLSGNAAMRIWTPNNYWSAQQLIASGAIQFNPAQSGEYLVMVEGLSNATYSVSSLLNGVVNRSVGSAETVQFQRPNLAEPTTKKPCPSNRCLTATTLRDMNTTVSVANYNWILVMVALVLCSLSGVVIRRNR